MKPEDSKRLDPLVQHYSQKDHPFTVCFRDQVAAGVSPAQANKRCAIVKSMVGGKKLSQLSPRDQAEMLALSDEQMVRMYWAADLSLAGTGLESLGAEMLLDQQREIDFETEFKDFDVDAFYLAADSMAKASTPEPFSTSKTSNWVAKVGGLPPYIQHVAHDLMEKGKLDESRAIAMAIGIVKNWAHGHDGKGNSVHPDTQAAASKAIAEWTAKKAASHAS